MVSRTVPRTAIAFATDTAGLDISLACRRLRPQTGRALRHQGGTTNFLLDTSMVVDDSFLDIDWPAGTQLAICSITVAELAAGPYTGPDLWAGLGGNRFGRSQAPSRPE